MSGIPDRRWWMSRAASIILSLIMLALSVAGCGNSASGAAQSPSAYLRGALQWNGAHSSHVGRVDWAAIRQQAMGMGRHAHTVAGTHPAIIFALEGLHDPIAFLRDSRSMSEGRDDGLSAMYPQRLVVDVEPGSAAQRAGVRVGDVIEAVDGKKPHAFEGTWSVDLGQGKRDTLTLRHPGSSQPITVTFVPAHTGNAPCSGIPRGRHLTVAGHRLGYIALPLDCGSDAYPGAAQGIFKSAAPACGWVIDLRQNVGGDIWTYLAAVGPILGNGKVGGFVYRDGTREWWEYRDGKVFWNGQERSEDKINGSPYRLTGPLPPVAVLTSRATGAAAELLAVAFHGRPHTRFLGEPTLGAPSLFTATALSDGSFMGMSGADSFDRTGRIYRGRIVPDEEVGVNWADLGTNTDPVLREAASWLISQTGCR